MSFVAGSGDLVQAGGYSTNENLVGPDLSQTLYGTHNTFGIPFEVVLKLVPLHHRKNLRFVVETK